MKASGYTLPEVLITMLIGGLLLLLLFDGIDMIRAIVRQNREVDVMSGLNKLEEYELLKERSDSLFIGDSIVFYMNGKEIGSCAKWE